MPLKGSQRRFLRARAHGLRPLVQVGKLGLAPAVVTEIDRALSAHELIKVRAAGTREEKENLARNLEQQLAAEAVGLVGHILILFRPHPDAEKRRIELPGG